MNKNEDKLKSKKIMVSVVIIVLGILLILFGLSKCGRSEGTEQPGGSNQENVESMEEDARVETGEEVTDEDSIRVAGPDEDMDADDGAFVLPDDEDYFDSKESSGNSANQEAGKSEAGNQQQTDKDQPSNQQPDTGDGTGDDESISKPVEEVEEKQPEESEQTSDKWGGLY